MINMDMQNDPRNWTSDTEWSNFHWANNVLGVYKIISDKLLSKLTPEIIDLYRSNGYIYSSSDAIRKMEKFDSNNLLLDRQFSMSTWIVVDDHKKAFIEKLHFNLNKDFFEITYIDNNEKTENILIPYNITENDTLFELNIQKEVTIRNIEYLETIQNESNNKEIEMYKLKIENINIECNKEIKRLVEQKSQIINLEHWSKILNRILSAKLPTLNKQNLLDEGLFYHVIEVNFDGEIRIDITNRFH